jgi:hypothetical protein
MQASDDRNAGHGGDAARRRHRTLMATTMLSRQVTSPWLTTALP